MLYPKRKGTISFALMLCSKPSIGAAGDIPLRIETEQKVRVTRVLGAAQKSLLTGESRISASSHHGSPLLRTALYWTHIGHGPVCRCIAFWYSHPLCKNAPHAEQRFHPRSVWASAKNARVKYCYKCGAPQLKYGEIKL